MSFMYKSMATRGPGKRKIKLKEENILRLIQEEDDDDEEDDLDYEIADNKSDDLSVSETEEEQSDSDKSNQDYEDCRQTSTSQVNVTRSNKLSGASLANVASRSHEKDYESPVISAAQLSNVTGQPGFSVNEMHQKLQKQWLALSSNMRHVSGAPVSCCVCLCSTRQSEIVVCQRCGVAVHKNCYKNLSTAEFSKPWLCDVCLNNKTKECEFCPSVDGCLRETSSGQWCHTICARYILKDNMWNGSGLIDMTSLNTKRYGSKQCSLCDDCIMVSTGICVKCDAGFCKTFFHVTCAQKYGLLSENDNSVESNTDPFFVYCPLHTSKESITRSQKKYIQTFHQVKVRAKKQNDEECEALQARRHRNFTPYTMPTPPNGVPPNRLLSSNAAAMRMLNRKAERMFDIDVRSPLAYFPRPSDVRRKQKVAPALTAEFASHFSDRELRIMELNCRVEQSAEENKQLTEKETNLRERYENLQRTQEDLQKQEHLYLKTSQKLFSMCVSLKHWAEENEKSKSPVKLQIKPPTFNNYMKSLNSKTKPAKAKFPTLSNKFPRVTALLNTCNICKRNNNQHLLIDCGVCRNWFHLACLDPPLTQMPRKSKFSLWQCSYCAPSSDTESDELAKGSSVTAEGRRVTRRSHKPPDKLESATFSNDEILEQKRMISYYSQTIRKTKYKHRQRLIKQMKKKKQTLSKELKKKPPSASLASKQPHESGKAEEPDKVAEENPPKNTDETKSPAKSRTEADLQKLNKLLTIPKTAFNLKPKVSLSPLKTPMLPAVSSSQVKVPSSKSTSTSPVSTSTSPVPAGIKKVHYVAKPNHARISSTTITVPPQSGNIKTFTVPLADFKSRQNSDVVTPPKSISVVLPNSDTVLSKTDLLAALGKLMIPPNKSGRAPLVQIRTSILHSNKRGMKKPIILSPPRFKRVVKDPNVTNTSEGSPSQKSPVKAADRSSSDEKVEKKDENRAVAEKVTINLNSKCKICKSSKDFKKMMICSLCKKYVHIWCCDPPLKAAPRSYKFCRWECSDCTPDHETNSHTEEESSGLKQTPDGRRRITRKRKPPEKFYLLDSPEQKRIENAIKKRRESGERISSRSARKTRNHKTPSNSSIEVSSSDENEALGEVSSKTKSPPKKQKSNEQGVKPTANFILPGKLKQFQFKSIVPPSVAPTTDVSPTKHKMPPLFVCPATLDTKAEPASTLISNRVYIKNIFTKPRLVPVTVSIARNQQGSSVEKSVVSTTFVKSITKTTTSTGFISHSAILPLAHKTPSSLENQGSTNKAKENEEKVSAFVANEVSEKDTGSVTSSSNKISDTVISATCDQLKVSEDDGKMGLSTNEATEKDCSSASTTASPTKPQNIALQTSTQTSPTTKARTLIPTSANYTASFSKPTETKQTTSIPKTLEKMELLVKSIPQTLPYNGQPHKVVSHVSQPKLLPSDTNTTTSVAISHVLTAPIPVNIARSAVLNFPLKIVSRQLTVKTDTSPPEEKKTNK